MEPILYKTITADAQITSQACYLIGVELTNAAATDTSLIIYDEANADKTAVQKVVTLATSDETQSDSRIFPYPGIKCKGLYADYNAGVGTIYYHY